MAVQLLTESADDFCSTRACACPHSCVFSHWRCLQVFTFGEWSRQATLISTRADEWQCPQGTSW